MTILYHVGQGLVLVALTVFIHAAGLRCFLWVIARYKSFWEKHHSLLVNTLTLTWVIGSLVVLHLAEIVLWAGYFYGMRLFPDLETAAYYSLLTYTTVGYGDVVLSKEWRLMGTSEALVGILMTAWSTALLVGVVSKVMEKTLGEFRLKREKQE